jgi:hypothetical protein
MSDYFVFGGRLRSELEFPDLSTAEGSGHPDWVLRLDRSPPPPPLELRGIREIEPGWTYRLFRVEGGFLLEYGGTGSYAVLGGGRELVWYPGTRPEEPRTLREMARAIVLGPVMALALQQSGVLCLHGSAVTIGGRAAAFLGPKFHGKSTLALALTAEGAKLLTDDLLAVDPAPPPMARPGVHSVRVLADVARHMGSQLASATLNPGFKTTVTDLPREDLAWEPAPLAAIYLLDPALELEAGQAVARQLLPPVKAAASLAHGKKLTDGLIGFAEAGSMLEWIVAVTAHVPVYRLGVLRDLSRISEVVGQLMAWHGAESASRDR